MPDFNLTGHPEGALSLPEIGIELIPQIGDDFIQISTWPTEAQALEAAQRIIKAAGSQLIDGTHFLEGWRMGDTAETSYALVFIGPKGPLYARSNRAQKNHGLTSQ